MTSLPVKQLMFYPHDWDLVFYSISCLHGGAQFENRKDMKSIMCLLCMVVVVEIVVVVEDVTTLVVVVGLVAAVEVALVDEVEEVMTGQILLMALMYWSQLETVRMKNGGNLHVMVDGCMWLRLVNE
jgi:hypothetical protein